MCAPLTHQLPAVTSPICHGEAEDSIYHIICLVTSCCSGVFRCERHVRLRCRWRCVHLPVVIVVVISAVLDGASLMAARAVVE